MSNLSFEIHSLVSNAQGNSISNWRKEFIDYRTMCLKFGNENTATLLNGTSIRTYNSDSSTVLWIIKSAHNSNSMLIDWN